MNGRVTTGRPAGSHLKKSRVVCIANIDMARRNIRALRLGMAAQAQVGIVGDEHFLIDGTMRVVTNGAALAQGLVLKNKRTCLVLVTLRATLILLCHRQAASRFKDVTAVRVVAVHAAHVAFDDGMMLWEAKFGLDVQVALKTGVWFFARIDDEAGRPAGTDMFTAGSVAGFAAALAGHGRIPDMQARVRAGGKFPDNFRVAIRAGLVADIVRAGDFQRRHHVRSGGA